jgi:hypothetical protein
MTLQKPHGARIAASLRAAIDEGVTIFRGVSEERTTTRTAPDAWCAREVIGHLIDSACNNHRRFIINQDADRLVVDPYQQDVWVARQRYADTPAAELVPMWVAYNRHIAHVIEAMPDEVLNRGRGPMGHFSFPYSGMPASDIVTLRHLVEDYVGHIHHHFNQIRSILDAG